MMEIRIDTSRNLRVDEIRAFGLALRRLVFERYKLLCGLNKEPFEVRHWLVKDYEYTGLQDDRDRVRATLKGTHKAEFLELEMDKCDDLLRKYNQEVAEFKKAHNEYLALCDAWDKATFGGRE